jgi:hypothetical protein
MTKERIEELYLQSIKLCNTIDKLAREEHLENTQDFLTWQDNINQISVR